ncbi:hypothetical protein [Halococcus sediminicola]|uniref:hypothetical protein n=1 Tax=Halococcus sediminicola TaxID=1264579 RepID=UPI000A4CAF3A|nr:hypothetical protein [Halococcus sediminicola]
MFDGTLQRWDNLGGELRADIEASGASMVMRWLEIVLKFVVSNVKYFCELL